MLVWGISAAAFCFSHLVVFGSLSGEVDLKMPSVFLPQVLSHERKRLLHRLPHRFRGNVCLVSCV